MSNNPGDIEKQLVQLNGMVKDVLETNPGVAKIYSPIFDAIKEISKPEAFPGKQIAALHAVGVYDGDGGGLYYDFAQDNPSIASLLEEILALLDPNN